MFWKSTADRSTMTPYEPGDQSWPDRLGTGNDSFGLPLIGTLLGYRAGEEPNLGCPVPRLRSRANGEDSFTQA